MLGYSGAGIVIDKDEKVTDLKIGQRVAYGGEGTGHGETINVGRNLIARVPDDVTFQEACFTTLGAIAMNSVRLAEIAMGDSVAVIGLGLVGQLVAQLARCQGAVVIAIDLDPKRVEMAKATGADFGIVASETTVEEVRALTDGRGADCVIVAAASASPKPLQQGVSMTRDRGRVIMVGACPMRFRVPRCTSRNSSSWFHARMGRGSYDPQYEKQGIDYPISYVPLDRKPQHGGIPAVARSGAPSMSNSSSRMNICSRKAPKAYETIMGGGGSALAVVLRYPINDAVDSVEDFVPTRKIVVNSAPVAKESLGFALVGAGNLAKWAHLPALQKIPGVHLQAVHSNSGRARQKLRDAVRGAVCDK